MIEMCKDNLLFSFPEVHADACMQISFQRTLRIPDDTKPYPLPPGLGSFPLKHVDDCGTRVSAQWVKHGGVMLPMYQAEAMWLRFTDYNGYPFAVKVAAGKINAVSGKVWKDGLGESPQNYLVVPKQPWLDGYCVKKGIVRQFVAAPLGLGYTAEEQITGHAEYGGLQIEVIPMKLPSYKRLLAKRRREEKKWSNLENTVCCMMPSTRDYSLGLAAGGQMRQEIIRDPHGLSVWDTDKASRCFVHICNSADWKHITGTNPPTKPVSCRDYEKFGLPWFEYYDEKAEPLPGSRSLGRLKSTGSISKAKKDGFLENESLVKIDRVVVISPKNNQITARWWD